ncbi:MFS transporter [Actinoplanes regularis]|uniref:Drug resistance transporter, EmrB/QacA subfamily n=1 Tax=Actinoplanes regularis TaxID=52697 RepID=A0A238W0F8_9ACTN|nr:MFS transporter [Actinoplanes regularis]GIE85372.1 MFS transporter [Actinoplanes regularis]SNR40085.1 drug resistance transporter, EmrB/QacA subfamily [Actinoplanes regularis]
MIENRTETRAARLVLALACACQFMVILDVSIINVALPSVRRDLGFTDAGLAWVVNGYVLAFAGLMLLGGRAADLFGRRRVLVAGLGLFSLASLGAGLASTPELLVGARAMQGLGGAMLAPATLAVINTCFPAGPARARAFGAWSASGGVGGMVGAVAGGVLTTGLSWRWVFLINVPIGVLLVAVAMTSLTATRAARRGSLDLAGAVTGTAGLAALVYGVMQTAEHAWGSARVLVPVLAGALLLAVFLLVEKHFAAAPMMPFRLFEHRGVAVSDVLLVLFGGVAVAMWFFSSLLMQNVLGFSALAAGLGQTPAAVTFVVVARLAAGRLSRTGVRPLILAGCAGFVAGFGWLSQAGAGSHYVTGVLGPTLLVAVGIGLVFPTLMASATAGVEPGDAGIVGGVANAAGQVGGAVALAVYATVAAARAGASPAPAALASGYELVFGLAAGVALAIAAVSLLLPTRQLTLQFNQDTEHDQGWGVHDGNVRELRRQ